MSTAKEVAIAERERQIAIIAAKRDAEQEATQVTVSAQAERGAAEDKAEATRTIAKADADAAMIRAQAQAKTYEVEAEGQRKLNEARNTLTTAIIEYEITKERLRVIPAALAEAVKPMEKIGDVRIIDLGGAMGVARGNGTNGGGSGSVPDNLLNSLLAYRANAPMIDSLLAEAGFSSSGGLVQSLVNGIAGEAPAASQAPKTEHATEAPSERKDPADKPVPVVPTVTWQKQ